jgi:phosphoribosylformylglycinamidine (FGAM) synthase-like amidotransferase family enzyme
MEARLMKTKVLVVTGDGINCERESARAFQEAGGEPTIFHINTLLEKPEILRNHQVFCLPGGFSFGDELRSGKILAEKMRVALASEFQAFTDRGGLTLGICNGFQILIQLGAFSGVHAKRESTLATNDHGTFQDRWTEVEITPDAQMSPWFQGMSENLWLPIRHKEGRIAQSPGSNNRIRFPLRYSVPVNGSAERAAAILDPSGRILGLMPHPEAATHAFLNPTRASDKQKEENAMRVRKFFENAILGAKQ